MENSLHISYYSYCKYECNRNVHYTLKTQIPPRWDWTIIRYQQQPIRGTRKTDLFSGPKCSHKWKYVNWWMVHCALKLTLSVLRHSYMKCRETNVTDRRGVKKSKQFHKIQVLYTKMMFTLKIMRVQLPHSHAPFPKHLHFAMKILQSIKRNNNVTTKSQFMGCGLLSYWKSSSWHFKGT